MSEQNKSEVDMNIAQPYATEKNNGIREKTVGLKEVEDIVLEQK